MKRRGLFSALSACAALIAAAGCGSNNCQDALNANTACAAKLNTTPGLDPQYCPNAACANKQGFIDCVVNLKCNDVASYNAAYDACLTSNGCP